MMRKEGRNFLLQSQMTGHCRTRHEVSLIYIAQTMRKQQQQTECALDQGTVLRPQASTSHRYLKSLKQNKQKRSCDVIREKNNITTRTSMILL